MNTDKIQARARARQLVSEFTQKGDHTGWFEPLYASAQGDTEQIPWADLAPNPHFVEWATEQRLQGNGQRALVIGCGLGDDAEELARLGFAVTAFDVSATAIAWCKQRFPNSQVDYQVADLLALPREWHHQFDFVLEIYTLQTLRQEIREGAMAQIAHCLAPNGSLLVICRGRNPEDDAGTMPWPLTRAEMITFEQQGLTLTSFEDYMDPNEPTVRRFRALYHSR